MGKGFEKYNNRYWECKQSQKGQSQKKVREPSQEKGEVEQKGWNFAKKWLARDHKSENHTVIACWGRSGKQLSEVIGGRNSQYWSIW